MGAFGVDVKRSIALLVVMAFAFGCASPRPWTKKEKTAAGFFVVAHVANAFSTKAVSDSPYCYESTPMMSRNTSDGEIAVYFSVSGALALLVSHFYPRTRVPLLMGYGGVNVFLTVYDYSLVEEMEKKNR